MICEQCKKLGVKSEEVFTKTERMFILASSVAMLRSVKAAANTRGDDVVASSVITKMLLSFTPGSRETLLQHFKQSIGMDITLKDCPHGKLAIVE